MKTTLIVKPRSTHNATQAEYVLLVALAKAGLEIPPADRNATEVLMRLVLPRKVVPFPMACREAGGIGASHPVRICIRVRNYESDTVDRNQKTSCNRTAIPSMLAMASVDGAGQLEVVGRGRPDFSASGRPHLHHRTIRQSAVSRTAPRRENRGVRRKPVTRS